MSEGLFMENVAKQCNYCGVDMQKNGSVSIAVSCHRCNSSFK